MCKCVRLHIPSPVYSNAGGLGSMTSNFQTLPLCLSTLRLLKHREKKKTKNDLVWLNPAHSTTQQTKTVKWNSHHHRKETRNKQVPQEFQKTYEYKMLISSDRFHPPPRQICVFICCFALCMKKMNARSRIKFTKSH